MVNEESLGFRKFNTKNGKNIYKPKKPLTGFVVCGSEDTGQSYSHCPLPTRQAQVPKAKVSRAFWVEAIADLDHGLFSKNANLLSTFG